MYTIDIDFNGSICHINELTKFFRRINWLAFEPGVVVHYSSHSRIDTYDFVVADINHEKKWVLLMVVNATRNKILSI